MIQRYDETVLEEFQRVCEQLDDLDVYVNGNGPINPLEIEPRDDDDRDQEADA